MPARPLFVRLGWTLRDYAVRVWGNSGEDNVLFLAGGIAFNILLAAVPFFLLLVTGATYLLHLSPAGGSERITAVFGSFFPGGVGSSSRTGAFAEKVLLDIVRARASLGIYSAIGFVWFSTRLFGSLRTVLADVFDIEHERGIIAGKIFDIKITVLSSLLLVAYTGISAYLLVGSTRGADVLVRLGIRNDVMGAVEYWFGRALATLFIVTLFFALYRYLPIRRVRWQTSLIAAVFTTVLLELFKTLFTRYLQLGFNPGSLYTGTLATLAILVVWVYYLALIFLIGGEVGQVYQLRHVRRLQREVLYEPDQLHQRALRRGRLTPY